MDAVTLDEVLEAADNVSAHTGGLRELAVLNLEIVVARFREQRRAWEKDMKKVLWKRRRAANG